MAVQDIEIFTGLISLFKGETQQLTWKVLPEDASNKEVTFTVVDPSVCTISDSGLITAIGNGKTEVIIRSVETNAVNKSFWVSSSVRVENLTLKEHSIQMSVGETRSIPFTITPEDASTQDVIWENENWDNPCININPYTGLIEAVADGDDVVYATAESNTEATDQCNIKVWTDVQGIIVYPTTIEMGVRDTATLNYMVFPDNASNPNVSISIDNTSLVNYTEEDSRLEALRAGSTIIHIKSVDNPKIESICQINVYSEKEPDELDYNKNDRIIQWKAEIYFDGKNKDPLIVSHENYLIDADLLEETSSDSSSPFGNVSSNEFSMTLLNENGMFNPTKKDSSYYGKIKKGIPIHAFCRPSDKSYVTWDDLGWFYVTDWTATITGINADITANDRLYNIFDMPMPKLPVIANITFAQAYQGFFEALNEEAKIDSALTETLKYYYNTRENKEFLSEISAGAQAYVYCDRDGIPKVQYFRNKQEIAHTLTDSDQIISISSKQSAILTYDGAEVIMNMPQESDINILLSVKGLELPVGKYIGEVTKFSKNPAYKITAALLTGDGDAYISYVAATCLDLIYEIQNDTNKDVTNSLEILGTFIDVVSTKFTDKGDNLLSIDNDYIQTKEYAQKVRNFLAAYVSNKVPVLELTIRGNVKYKLGEKLHIISDRYAVDFTGVLIRQNFHYDGGMSCTIKLLNSAILEV